MTQQDLAAVAAPRRRWVPPFRTFSYCLIEARPVVQVIFLMRFGAGAILSHNAAATLGWRVLVAAVAWWAATVCIYTLNGLMDVTEDRCNGSQRPIARGVLAEKDAAAVCWTMAAVSIVLAATAGTGVLLMLLAFLALGHAYSSPPFTVKRHTGGAVAVAGLGGLATYTAGYLADAGALDASQLVFALAMSLWMGLVGIQAKDLSDVVGDAKAGRRTIALRWPENRVRALVAGTAVVVGASFVALAWFVAAGMLPLALCVLAGAVVLSVVAHPSYSSGSRLRRRRPYRVFMVTQYAAHLGLVAWLFLG